MALARSRFEVTEVRRGSGTYTIALVWLSILCTVSNSAVNISAGGGKRLYIVQTRQPKARWIHSGVVE
jgi:hypothetical protein